MRPAASIPTTGIRTPNRSGTPNPNRPRQLRTALERHFDLVTAKNGLARPAEVIASYKSPIRGHKEAADRKTYMQLSMDVDAITSRCFAFYRQVDRAEKDPRYLQLKRAQLEQMHGSIAEDLEKLVKRGRQLFDDKTAVKTFGMAIDESLLKFLQLVISGERSFNTYKKQSGTKRRWQDFLRMRYKRDDIPMEEISLNLIEEFVHSEKTVYKSQHNTIWKYVQILQEICTRAFHKEWTTHNRFAPYDFKYQEPKGKKWLSMEDILTLINADLSGYPKRLDTIRWLFVYQSFAAPAYAELMGLSATGIANRAHAGRVP